MCKRCAGIGAQVHYGGGMITNWGVQLVDSEHWYLQADAKGPIVTGEAFSLPVYIAALATRRLTPSRSPGNTTIGGSPDDEVGS